MTVEADDTVIRVTAVAAAIIGALAITTSASAHAVPNNEIEAVCRPGSFYKSRPFLQFADDQGFCLSFKGNPILIGQYKSMDTMGRDAMTYNTGSIATRSDNDEVSAFFSPKDPSGQSLQPLDQFCYTITHRRGL
ncbi:hypothetical protein [Mycobacterium sp. M23085]|uniref:hypothetical protein n=1 Tax=Mycobacterium sp. M23085 TaxID=3378087 RepID=UPI00387832E1